LPENRGGAGGYHFGIRQAYDIGADWIWTLDDDSVPEPSALSALLDAAARLPDSGFLASAVLWTDGSPHVMNQPHFVGRDDSDTPAIRSASFVSILINRTAIATVGYPIRQFFIHYDDMEYTRRITTAGFPAFLVKASRATHATVSNAGVTLRNMRSIRPEQRTEWEYTIRNLVAVNRRRPFGWLREPMRLCVLAARLLVSATPPAIGAAIVKAGLKGLFMRYEKRIEYPKKMKSSE
jgi:GT2 family glycosyltransferase